ncbi:bifunctional 2-polyprenyl-6-hydroxyphenol methylase/3-demethylubiquinol 3-O-methyltransferase UbiG [Arthrobacter alpinus]|uniref:class I SAM-dependent methyltransferase n=1 Tax=Arthrobacter alpinus TaxID=656366 RepID=UPI0016454648|nr:class I SAM-dependent methyltransferase [Arthrobacter alpinus]
MTLVTQPAVALGAQPRDHVFGHGSDEPYARALRLGKRALSLELASTNSDVASLSLRVREWCESATPAEVSLLLASGGPVLDVGCGPGRMLVAAAELGLRAWGVDVGDEAVAQARSRGAMVLHQSIFEALPHEGSWGLALLLDGNIGIGGNVPALLRRMKSVLAPAGSVLVEVELQESLDVSFFAVLRGSGSKTSDPFPWARVGSAALAVYAVEAGWTTAQWITIPSADRRRRLAAPGLVQERLICRLTPRA